jgi:DNA helicase IV
MIEKIKIFLDNKKNKIIDLSSKNLQIIEKQWTKFAKSDKYLTYQDKMDFKLILGKKDELAKIPWYFYFNNNIKKTINGNLSKLDKYSNILRGYNENFILTKQKEYEPLFGKSPYPLDENQKRAVIKDDKHNLVVAGAGSGKTETLITRIAYLINRKSDKIKKDRILALAFQDKAAKEIRQRLKERYDLDVEVKTFHAIGRKILDESAKRSGKKVSKLKFSGKNADKLQSKYIEELFKKTERKLHNKIINYLKVFGDDEIEKGEGDFEKKAEYLEYMRSLRYTALDGTKVKSLAERIILNFFITHNLSGGKVDIKYESPATWMDYEDANGNKRTPEPDFYFPEYGIYLEHWAIDESGKVPEWFEGDYLESMKIKKEKFKNQNVYSLVESSYGDYSKPNFEEVISRRMLKALKEKYPDEEFKFEEVQYEFLVNKVWKDGKDALKVLSQNISNFIRVAKTYNLTPKDVRKNIVSKKWSRKQQKFAELAVELYEIYQQELKKSNEIDFADMINLAIENLKSDSKLYFDKFDHILIDEYQDISYQRFELINVLMKKNPNCKLFCVGDDWQSIMGFSGSNLDFFVHFEDYFNHPERTDLTINYRSIKSVVDTGAEIIRHNKEQLGKEANAHNQEEKKITVYSSLYKNGSGPETKKYNDQVAEHCIKKIKKLHDEGYAWRDMMILRRICPPGNWMSIALQNEAEKQDVPLSEDVHNPTTISNLTVHQSKGLQARIVFILGVDKGPYGFPNELQNLDTLKPATRGEKNDKEEEERRLFYVAVTRAKEDVIIYHQKCAKSKFLDEIKMHVVEEEIGDKFGKEDKLNKE